MQLPNTLPRPPISLMLMGLLLFGAPFQPKAHADPCGMVPPPPPPYLQKTTLIERVGAQKTFVFYKRGIESIVLRPGFKGKVSNFGMLIPFPSPPAIRKVPNEIFSHITAAIDPPEVVVRVQRFRRRWGRSSMLKSSARPVAESSRGGDSLSIHAVRVLRQEAVGMYQVAVLQAGSPMALKRWMKRHGYMYPQGMDKVCYEYIRARWTFVAVKARVAGKNGITARPGMRSVSTAFPKGGVFTGKVQAMGFRFRTRRLVVPMRLSAFNKGRLHNIVYLLTDSPKRIKRIPRELVVRQITGKQLYRNVMEPLPLRVIGGSVSMIRPWRWQQAQRLRDPSPHNGHARDLFASDLFAARKNRLSLHHEREKKVLLRIGERLRLRGKHMDKLNRDVLKEYREEAVKKAMADLKSMTLTVVDGDFKREVLKADNLTFTTYRMKKKCNTPGYYNARTLLKRRCAGAPQRVWGTLYTKRGPYFKRFRKTSRNRRTRNKQKLSNRQLYKLIRRLSNAKRAGATVARLVKAGKRAVPYLLGEAIEGYSWSRRGWSLVALSDIPDKRASKGLLTLTNDNRTHPLIRHWSAAAFIKKSTTAKEFLSLSPWSRQQPGIKRPLRLRVTELLQQNPEKAELLFSIAGSIPSLHAALRPMLIAQTPKTTLTQMIKAPNLVTRRTAASYASMHMKNNPTPTIQALHDLLKFDKKASKVPWDGGALYIPAWPSRGVPAWNAWQWSNQLRQLSYRGNWQLLPEKLRALANQIQDSRDKWAIAAKRKKEADKHLKQDSRKLIHTLLAWGIWSDLNNKKAELRKILINLRSWQLTNGALIGRANQLQDLESWLIHWYKAAGKNKYRTLLREVGVQANKKYAVGRIIRRQARQFKRLKQKLEAVYLGCFLDNSRRDLPLYVASPVTPQTCRKLCVRRGYKFAGLQYRGQCFCGNSHGRYGKVPENQCSYPCTKDKRFRCGGAYRNSIYLAR